MSISRSVELRFKGMTRILGPKTSFHFHNADVADVVNIPAINATAARGPGEKVDRLEVCLLTPTASICSFEQMPVHDKHLVKHSV